MECLRGRYPIRVDGTTSFGILCHLTPPFPRQYCVLLRVTTSRLHPQRLQGVAERGNVEGLGEDVAFVSKAWMSYKASLWRFAFRLDTLEELLIRQRQLATLDQVAHPTY